ncbi:condensation domain-containing protein [Streptomyces sp. rh34]|uniref:condensation domain-containing protein n=1 Tax=Streptomyces sp. rh34 TaxID=2034272 RepID=UPI000BF0D155|nr:condensation domain-containing protein [Streptomyces sp. rh34]
MNSAAGKDTMHLDTPRTPPTPRTVTVAYAGGDERRGPLTMGQANMIRCILRDDPEHINNHDVWAIPPGVGPDDVTDALRTLALRHEGLRTTFPHAPGSAPVEQVVAAEGTFAMTVLDHAEFPGEPARYAESVARAARAGRFALGREFPLRISLLTLRGVPVHVALASSHAVTDGSALAVLREEFLALLAGEELPAPASFAPLDLAAEEASPTGKRKSEASLRYWERIIRTEPQEMFAEPRAAGADGRARQLTLRSRRGARALARAAGRTGNPEATVLLAAWCALVAHRAGQDSCVTAVPTSNRFHARSARSVNTLSQDALLCLDVRVPSFDTLVRKTWGAALNAYKHSQFDSVRLWEMIDRVTGERGSHFARDVVFNDVSVLPATLLSTAPAAADGADEPELAWGPFQALPTRMLAFTYETTPRLHISLWADPALFTANEAEGFLSGLVLLLEAAAERDVPLDSLTGVTGVRPAERGPDWVRVDGCWVSPSAVREALSGALGGLPVHIDTDQEAGLTAYMARGGDTSLTPAGAHAALMAEVGPAHGGTGVLAPHRYVLVESPPAEADRSDAWRRLHIIEEGTGRSRQVRHER